MSFPTIKAKTADLIPYANNSRTHSDEQWLKIPDYDYLISNKGNVKRIYKTSIRDVKTCDDKYGRKVFNVSKNGKVKQLKVHRAVMMAFVGECPKGMEVAHLDGNQSNNTLDNLIYATPKENSSHKLLHGTQPMGEKIWMSRLQGKDVLEIRQTYPSLSYSKLAKKYGVHIQTIASIIQRKNWKHI